MKHRENSKKQDFPTSPRQALAIYTNWLAQFVLAVFGISII